MFTISTRLVMIDGWVHARVLNGWKHFFQLVRLICQWRHTNKDVDQIESLVEGFYRHFVNLYYRRRRNRVHFCKYVSHLTLHIAQHIRDYGPVSLPGQWTTENFVRYTNRITHAKHLFAQWTREKIKYHVVDSLYRLRYGTQIPHIEDDDVNNNCNSPLTDFPSPNIAKSEQDRFSLLAPSLYTSISKEEKKTSLG